MIFQRFHKQFYFVLSFIIVFTNNAKAQYTLVDNDVEVINGVITSCNYSFIDKNIIIPSTLDGQTVIGIASATAREEGIFYAHWIKSVQFPSTLTYIGDYAFYDNSIHSIDLSICTVLTTIGNYAFEENHIDGLDLSNCNALTTIGKYAFRINSITSLDLRNCKALMTIGDYAFDLNNIENLGLSGCKTLTSIGNYAFNSNSYISSVDLSNCIALISIGNAAFQGNELSLKSVNLTNCTSLTSIGDYAFAWNRSIYSLDLTNCKALQSIGEGAFYDNLISEINLTNCEALRSIGRFAFDENSISSFTLPTPSNSGYTFNYWEDGNSNIYDGGENVADLTTSYAASLDLILGINDKEYITFKVYPNPSSEKIYIESLQNIYAISIYDISGKRIFTKNNIIKTGNITYIDISAVKSGVYLLQCNTDNESYTNRIIIQ